MKYDIIYVESLEVPSLFEVQLTCTSQGMDQCKGHSEMLGMRVQLTRLVCIKEKACYQLYYTWLTSCV